MITYKDQGERDEGEAKPWVGVEHQAKRSDDGKRGTAISPFTSRGIWERTHARNCSHDDAKRSSSISMSFDKRLMIRPLCHQTHSSMLDSPESYRATNWSPAEPKTILD